MSQPISWKRITFAMLLVMLFSGGVLAGSAYTKNKLMSMYISPVSGLKVDDLTSDSKADFLKAADVKRATDEKGQNVYETDRLVVTMLEPIKFIELQGGGQGRIVSTLTVYKHPVPPEDAGKPPVGKKVLGVIFSCADNRTVFMQKMLLLSPTDEWVGQDLEVNKIAPLKAGSPMAAMRDDACKRKDGDPV